jgi:hypothetical protein
MRHLLLTKTFHPDQYAAALESWAWIGLEDNVAVMSSSFGAVFLESADGYWYLDVIGGWPRSRWPDAATLQAVPPPSENAKNPQNLVAALEKTAPAIKTGYRFRRRHPGK